MSMRKLDRGRYYAVVYGDPKKKYMQDGMFFDGAGIAVDGAVEPKEEPVPANEPVVVVEVDDSKVQRIKELQAMTVPALKKLAKKVSDATGTDLPEFGTGVQARLVAYIAEHTE